MPWGTPTARIWLILMLCQPLGGFRGDAFGQHTWLRISCTEEVRVQRWFDQRFKWELDRRRGVKPGSSKELSSNPNNYFDKLNRDTIQRLAFEKTFGGWTDEDWAEFDQAFGDFVDDL